VADGREALRDQIVRTLRTALSSNYEITPVGYRHAAEAILDLGMEQAKACDRKGRTSGDWPPQFERLVLSIYGPVVPVGVPLDDEEEKTSG
jgi:hypothetical protein